MRKTEELDETDRISRPMRQLVGEVYETDTKKEAWVRWFILKPMLEPRPIGSLLNSETMMYIHTVKP